MGRKAIIVPAAITRRLQAASPHFARLWEQHGVSSVQSLTKKFRNPYVGLLRLDVTMSRLAPAPGTRLMVYTPSDAQTRRRLDELAAIISAQPVENLTKR